MGDIEKEEGVGRAHVGDVESELRFLAAEIKRFDRRHAGRENFRAGRRGDGNDGQGQDVDDDRDNNEGIA